MKRGLKVWFSRGGDWSLRHLLILFLILIILLSFNKVSALSFTINSPQNNTVYNSAKLILDVDTDVDSKVWFNIDGETNNSINYSRDIRDDDDTAENKQTLYSSQDIYKNLTSTLNLTENATSARVYFYVGQFPTTGIHGAGANITVTVNGNSPIHFDTKDLVRSVGSGSYNYHWHYVDTPISYLNSFNNTIILETTESGGGDYYLIGRDTDNDYNRSFYGNNAPDNNETGEYMVYLKVYYTTNNLTTNGTYYFDFNDEGTKTINIYANDSAGNFNQTSITINFRQKKEIAIFGGNATQYNIALRQFFNLYGIPVDILDRSASIDEIYKYRIAIEGERSSSSNASEDYIVIDWIERGGKYLDGTIRYHNYLFLDKVFGGDNTYLQVVSTLNNTNIIDSSTHLTDDWSTINERLINYSISIEHHNVSSGYPNKTYVNWTNGTFTAPFYFSHDIGNGTIYVVAINENFAPDRSTSAYSFLYQGDRKWRFLLFDNFFREMNYSAKLQISPMKELRIDDPLAQEVGADNVSVSNWTTLINKLRETGTIADLYIIASKIDNGNGDWIKEYLKNASDVLNYGIHGWVHEDFGNYTDSITVEEAEANFTAAINNISDYFGSVKRIWVPPSHDYCINTTIAMANLNITFFSDGVSVKAKQGVFEDIYQGISFYNYSSGTYNLGYTDFIYQTGSNWSIDWNLSHIMNERIGQPMIFYTHGYQINKWYGLWTEHLIGDKKQPYHRWVGLDDIGEAVRALNEKTINDYVVNDTEAMMNFTLTRNVSGLDFLIYVPSGKHLIPYIDGQEHWAYYTDEWGRTHIMLPNMTSGEHIVRAVFNDSASNKPYLKYSVPFIKNITSYNETTKRFVVVLFGKGVNKTVTIIYNATQNFEVKDNSQSFAFVSDGILDSSNSNSSYQLSYNYSTGIFNFTIPTMSEHSIIFEDDTTAPTISFSCSPTSVTSGETITCSCSATDASDSSPTISYTVNPSTSSTGTFTTTCTATDDTGNSASSSISYSVSSSGGGGTPTYKPIQEQLQEGYEKSLRKNWKIQFEFNNKTHAIKLDNIVNKTAIITVSSEPVTFNLTINEAKKLNLDDDNYYDLEIFLKDISDYEADLVVKLIYEEIPCEPDWKCEEWGGCINYTQTRTCIDLNNCNTTEGKPDEVRSCCEPDWECTQWSECIEGEQTRICTDLNNCNVTIGKPDEIRDCEAEVEWWLWLISGLVVVIVVAIIMKHKKK